MRYPRGPKASPRLALAVMAKAPIPGEAKTRLGATLGHQRAASVYSGLLADTLAIVDALARQFDGAERLVVCPNAEHASQLGRIAGPEWTIAPQQRTGLLGGIADAFDFGFARGANLVVVTDADSPLALANYLADCVALTVDSDLVLGPTRDGGYYLIAAGESARPRLADLLLGVTYDSATICAATTARGRALDLSVGFGPRDLDVDTRDDLRELTSQLAAVPSPLLAQTRGQLDQLSRESILDAQPMMRRAGR